jgi:hypothetical protein
MLKLLDRSGFYLAIPAGLQAFLVIIFFNLNFNVLAGAALYFLPIFFASIILFVVPKSVFSIFNGASKVIVTKFDRWICLFFSWLIIGFGVLDLLINGVKILDPGSYAEFHGYGRYFRHFSTMCWLLIPIGVLCIKSKYLRSLFFVYALIFPIIIVDRNRLLLSFFACFFCYIVFFDGWKRTGTNVALLSLVLLLFSALGAYRSGSSFDVQSSGEYVREGFLPLRALFFELPSFLRQIVLYITTPVVNYSIVYSLDFYNSDFLLSQLSPFGRAEFDEYPFSPVPVKRFNVGTEFFPQLMYGGVFLSWCSFFLMCVSFLLVIRYLRFSKSIFSLIIFLKIAHSIVFLGFAPQFFIFYNFAFVVLFFCMDFLSDILGYWAAKLEGRRSKGNC